MTDDETAGGAALASAVETVSITITGAHWAAVAEPLAVTTVKDRAVDVELPNVGNQDSVKDLTLLRAAGSARACGNFSSSYGCVTILRSGLTRPRKAK